VMKIARVALATLHNVHIEKPSENLKVFVCIHVCGI